MRGIWHFRRRKRQRHIKTGNSARKRGAEVHYLHRERARAKSLALRCLYPEAGKSRSRKEEARPPVFDVTHEKFVCFILRHGGWKKEIFREWKRQKGEKVMSAKSRNYGLNGSPQRSFWSAFPSCHGALLWRKILTGIRNFEEPSGTDEQSDPENGDSGQWNVDDGKRGTYQGICCQDCGNGKR